MVLATAESSQLLVRTQSGTSVAGKPVFKNRAYNNVKVTASDDDVYAIGQAMANLQSDPVVAVERLNTSTLSENQ